jgi:hypothetical protein
MPAVLNTRRARGESGKCTQVAQAVQELGTFLAVFRVTDAWAAVRLVLRTACSIVKKKGPL